MRRVLGCFSDISAVLLVALIDGVLGDVTLIALFLEIFRDGVTLRSIVRRALAAARPFRAAVRWRHGRRFGDHVRLIWLPSAGNRWCERPCASRPESRARRSGAANRFDHLAAAAAFRTCAGADAARSAAIAADCFSGARRARRRVVAGVQTQVPTLG